MTHHYHSLWLIVLWLITSSLYIFLFSLIIFCASCILFLFHYLYRFSIDYFHYGVPPNGMWQHPLSSTAKMYQMLISISIYQLFISPSIHHPFRIFDDFSWIIKVLKMSFFLDFSKSTSCCYYYWCYCCCCCCCHYYCYWSLCDASKWPDP